MLVSHVIKGICHVDKIVAKQLYHTSNNIGMVLAHAIIEEEL